MDGIGDRAILFRLVRTRQQLQQVRRYDGRSSSRMRVRHALPLRCSRSSSRCADPAAAHTSRPLHVDWPDPARERVVSRFNLDAAIQMPVRNRTGSNETAPAAAPAERALFGEHRRHLTLGAAVVRLSAISLPSVQIRLCLFQLSNFLPFNGVICAWLTHSQLFLFDPDRALCMECRHAIVRQHIGYRGFKRGS